MMNFPIYHNDYPFSLEEIYRYLKCFHEHSVFITIPRTRYHQDDLRGVSIHEFAHDGLTIRLSWTLRKPETFRPEHISSSELFRRHKEKEFSLLYYEISQLSKSFKASLQTPDEECRHLFAHYVLQGRPSNPLNEQDYQSFEYPSLSTSIPNIYFDWLIQYNQNKVDFEKFYQKRQQNNRSFFQNEETKNER